MAKAMFKDTRSLAEKLRDYGIDEVNIKRGRKALRYMNPIEKGVYWYWFSKYVRMRDALSYGRCISCNTLKTFAELQAGHYAPAGGCGFLLLFDERNVNGECGRCNAWDEGHLFGYEKGLDTRYGTGTAAALKHRYEMRMRPENVVSEWSALEYGNRAMEMRKKFEDLSTQISVLAPETVLS